MTARAQHRNQRLSTYSRALAVLRSIEANAHYRALYPGAESLEEPSETVTRQLEAEVALLGSEPVREQLRRVGAAITEFHAALFLPALRDRVARSESATGEHPDEITDRLALGAIADRVTEALNELETRMRAEVEYLV